jgi:hypothetical protein
MIGSEDVKEANMLTNLWQYELQDKIGNKIVSFETWSAVACLPVDFVHFSKGAGINIVKRLRKKFFSLVRLLKYIFKNLFF